MIATDEDALICDFAETYHIYDYRGLPLRYAATLASGLRAESRIMMKVSGQNASPNTTLLAALADGVHWLQWAQTEDGHRNRNRPYSILEGLQGKTKKKKETGFRSGKDFEAARNRILERIK